MKRTDLAVGMLVELSNGSRDYPTYTEHVIVLDTKLWESVPRWQEREGSPPYRPVSGPGRGYTDRGIPVAVRRPVLNEATDEHIEGLYEWVPRLVRTQIVFPAGTKAKAKAAEQASRERDAKIEAERKAKQAAIKDRCSGLTVWIYDHDVKMSHAEFEKLLKEAGR